MLKTMLASAFATLVIACSSGETIDDCYWRISETEQNMFKLRTVIADGLSPELEKRLKEAWERVDCKAELPPPGSLYFVKEPAQD